jgi:hypothetical protein
MSHRTSIIVGIALIAVGLPGFSEVSAGIHLTYHWDRDTETSTAVVTDSADQVIAEVGWAGALPRSYGAGVEEIDTPTFVLAQLRNLLLDSVDPEADDALAFVRQLMGPYADTDIGEISVDQSAWIGYADYEIVEWCGSDVGSRGECLADEEISIYSTLCRDFACKGTTVIPSP